MKGRLSTGFKLSFSLANMGFSTLRSMADFFLLFYITDVAGIDPAIAGSALLFGKLTWDAINDPLFGYWSDKTRSRFGRRRIYMLAAALPIAVATWIQFSLPHGLTGVAAFLAVLLTFWLKDTAVTLGIVPYFALAPEVTSDYRERNSLGFYLGLFSILGYIVGATGITLTVGALKGAGLGLQQSWGTAAAIYGIVAFTTLLVTTLTIKERGDSARAVSKLPPLKAFSACFSNRPFMLLMAVLMLGQFAFTVQAALLPYLLRYQLQMADQTATVLFVSIATIGVFLFPAKLVSDRINKGPAYALGLFIAAVTFILMYFFMPYGPSPLVYVAAVLLGIGFSAQWVIPVAMLPDVIEFDEQITGERREGVYTGLHNFLTKLSVALGIAVPAWALSGFGYVPNAVQTETAQMGIRIFYALVPAAVMLVCVPLLIWYPVTRKSHAALVQELAETRAASASKKGKTL
jgi:GPH family glycoside/pentoside/hexuronide:cation symporter